jgi:hypothetical protein
VVRLLLDKGALLDEKNKEGDTARASDGAVEFVTDTSSHLRRCHAAPKGSS